MGMLTTLRIKPPGLRSRLRQFDLERRVALVLAVIAVIAGFATYLQISSAPPFGGGIRWVVLLLNLDLILLLLLGVLIARRLVQLVLQRRRGLHGSRLHGRLVALFGLVAIAPSIIVSIFSITFLSSGLEAWFSERIHTALTNSLRVAQAYLEEHKANIRADALAMAADLSREVPFYFDSPSRLEKLVNAQAALRALSEAVLFDAAGNVLARSGLSFTFELDRLPMEVLDKADRGEVVVLTSDADDRVRAVLRLEGLGKVYLVVGRFVDPEVLGFVQRTQEVVSEYEAMQKERSDVQIASALIFGIIALLLLLAAVWTGLNFADRLATPLARLIAAAERVRSGDLMARVPETDADDEIAVLSRAFNRMTSQLSSQQRALIEANQQLDRRRRFTEAVLTGVSAGVLGLDSDHTILLPNRQALDFLAIEGGDVTGKRIEEVMPEALPLFARLDGQEASVTGEIVLGRAGQQRTLLVRLAAQREGGETIGYVMTFDDITELLSAQRQAAWAEVARRIAHEIKNPLTPIRLSAERLRRKYLRQIREDAEVFENSILTITRQVDTIGRLISEFSAFARMPAAVMREESLDELVRHAVLLQQSAWPGITLSVEAPERPVRLSCDGEKVTQALTNLLKNAAEALSEKQAADADGEPPRIRVVVTSSSEAVTVEVQDNGPGLPGGSAHRLFEPYVTSKPRGSGLGLAIVRKIMEEHGGLVELTDSPGGGVIARLVFPRPAAA